MCYLVLHEKCGSAQRTYIILYDISSSLHDIQIIALAAVHSAAFALA